MTKKVTYKNSSSFIIVKQVLRSVWQHLRLRDPVAPGIGNDTEPLVSVTCFSQNCGQDSGAISLYNQELGNLLLPHNLTEGF